MRDSRHAHNFARRHILPPIKSRQDLNVPPGKKWARGAHLLLIADKVVPFSHHEVSHLMELRYIKHRHVHGCQAARRQVSFWVHDVLSNPLDLDRNDELHSQHVSFAEAFERLQILDQTAPDATTDALTCGNWRLRKFKRRLFQGTGGCPSTNSHCSQTPKFLL